jgi:hypothetical protein
VTSVAQQELNELLGTGTFYNTTQNGHLIFVQRDSTSSRILFMIQCSLIVWLFQIRIKKFSIFSYINRAVITIPLLLQKKTTGALESSDQHRELGSPQTKNQFQNKNNKFCNRAVNLPAAKEK